MKKFDDISAKLLNKSIKPSIQRIKILEYLINCMDHPTADQIHNGLVKKVHSLSKATVYNTLTLFAEKGLIRVLTMEGNENRFDIKTQNHGHFICEKCGKIIDFEINMDKIKTNIKNSYKITQKDVYFKGVCPKCL